ncbi:MAG: hypothetical protein WCO66_00500 [Candidatus Absconditabacteria bacterium]
MENKTQNLLTFLQNAEGSGKKFSSDELKSMLVSVSFDIDACKVILPKIKDQTILFSFIPLFSKNGILNILFPLLDWKSKSNDELLSIFTQSGESESVANTIAKYLDLTDKKEPELLEIISKLCYCRVACDKIIPLLNFSKTKRHQEKIWLFIENSRFNDHVVGNVIRYVLDEDRIMKLLKRENFREGLFYDEYLKEVVIIIKGSDNIAEVVANVSNNIALCAYYIPKIKSETDRFELARDLDRDSVWLAVIPTLKKKEYVSIARYKVNKLDRYSYSTSLYILAFIPHCSSEEEILKVAKVYSLFKSDDEFLFAILEYVNQTDNLLMLFNEVISSEVKAKIIPKLNLPSKENAQLWDILTQTKYDKAMCEAIVSLLGLIAKSDDELIKLLSERQNPQNLCLSVMPYLKSQANRVKVFHYHTDKEYIWHASGYLNDATLEAEFISSYYRKYFLRRIHNKELVYQTIAKEKYPEDLIFEANKVFKK